MTSFIEAVLHTPLLQTALIACLLASIASGVIGSYVVVKRIVFISGSIAHSVLSGMGLCLWLKRTQGIEWLTPTHGALIAAIISALLIGWVHLKFKQREDAVIAAIWSIGMATGVLFISQTPGSNVELTNFLLGNILWTSRSDLLLLAALDILTLLGVYFLHPKFLSLCFDEDHTKLQGVPVQSLYFLLLVFIAIAVVLLVQVVGIILVITMLTIPPTIANLFSQRLSRMMLLSTLIGTLFSFTGMATAYHFDSPPGATIALTSGLIYLISIVIAKNSK